MDEALRGAFREWPAVRAALVSDESGFYDGTPVAMIAAPAYNGRRFLCRAGLHRMNFERSLGPYAALIEEIG